MQVYILLASEVTARTRESFWADPSSEEFCGSFEWYSVSELSRLRAGQMISVIIEEKFVQRCCQYQVFASVMGSCEELTDSVFD